MNINDMYTATEGRHITTKKEPELLTHPNIPKPLHSVNPRSILGQKWWDKERQKAYKERHYHCFACGIHKSEDRYHKWLEAHEDYDINYETGMVELKRIVALCHCCHNFIHGGRLKILLDKGEINDEKYNYIMKRGRKILKESKLNQWNGGDIKKVAKWNEWKLVLNGKEYYSKFNNMDEWRRHYEHK